MAARTKSVSVARETQMANPSRRYELRYHFAELLRLEKFDLALTEARVAYGKRQVYQYDLGFVIAIVEAAGRLGQPRLRQCGNPSKFFQKKTRSIR